MTKSFTNLLLVFTFAALAPRGQAQGTKADYERAANLPKATANLVLNAKIKAHWLANGTQFWYRVDRPGGGHDCILIDAIKGTRQAGYEPKQTGEAELPAADQPHASRTTGESTHITFTNKTKAVVELFWIDTGGKRHRYATVAPGEQHRQQTFAGHVWLAADTNGKALAVFTATDDEATAVIGENRPAPTPEKSSPKTKIPTAPHPSAFIRDHNVWLRDPDVALTTDGTTDDAYDGHFFWSPDGKRLVAMRTTKGDERKVYLVESSPKDQLQPKLDSYDYLKPGDKIAITKPHLFDVVAKKEIPVTDALFPNPWSLNDVRWAPDSSRFTFLYNQRGHQILRIVEVNAQTGATRALVNEVSPTFIDYADKSFTHWLSNTNELIWMSERDGWNHLYLYDSQTGRVKNQITKGAWVVRGVDQVDEANRQIWFHAGGIRPGQDPYYIHFCRVNFNGTGLVVLTEGDGTHSIDYSPDRRFFVDTWSRVDLPPVTELRRSDTGALVCPLESATLTKSDWRLPERFVAKGRDGVTDIFGIIIRPTNFDPRKKYPVIENIYAGPQAAHVAKAFKPLHSPQEIAELGFVVVEIDGMGTSHRSKKFHDVCWKNLVDAGFPDRILWLKAAAQKYPSLDLTRVGIYGGSAGGQNALGALLTHGDFYKVAVADCGCHDNRMDKIWWNELWMSWPVGKEYEEQSNVTLAPKLQGKLLLTVGELDHNVDPSSTLQVVNALIKADKDFEFLIIPGAGHGCGETPYGKRRRADFFVRHLLGTEPRR